MTEYVVQLEYDAGEVHHPEWRQVARSDTSHDFFHIDVHYVDGEKEKLWSELPQTLSPAEEYRFAKGYLERNEYTLLRETGYVD